MVLEYAGAVAVALMCLMIIADVLAKFLLGKPIIGTLELVSNYFMIAVVFLPMAAVQHLRDHVDVEIFTLFLGPRALAALDTLVTLVGTVAMTTFAWVSGVVAYKKFLSGEAIGLAFHSVPIWPARWILPLAAVVFALVLVSQCIASARRAFGSAERRDA